MNKLSEMKNNEIFEGNWKDKKAFKIPHKLNYNPSAIHTFVRGVNISYWIAIDEEYIYFTFIRAPNKRFMFSWE